MILNLKTVFGRGIFTKLIKWADVLIDPYRATTLPNLGFGFEELVKLNPSIIYCNLTTYGASGKLNKHAGHDINFVSSSGLMRSIFDMESNSLTIPGVYIVSLNP